MAVMREWFGLVEAELLKIGRRRLSWFLLAAVVAASVLHGRALRTDLLDYRQAEQSGVGRLGQGVSPDAARVTAADLARRMTFPAVLYEAWVTTDFWGLLALIILGALQAGEEFDLVTARTLLLRGVSRARWPLAKLAALAVAAAVLWVVLAVTIVPIGLWTQAQAGGGSGLAAVDASRWAEHGLRLMRSWFTTLPYLAFSVWAATLARGTGPALALGLGGRFVEVSSTVVGPLLIGMEAMGSSVTHALCRVWAPLHAISFEWSSEVIRTWGRPSWVQPLSPMPASPQVLPLPSPFFDSPLIALLLLVGWTSVWMIWTAWSVGRRDVTA
jgi:hypothetical protein